MLSNTKRCRHWGVLLGCALQWYALNAHAVVTAAGDGIGTTVSAGPAYTIGGGTQSGSNLFHSFTAFTITGGQSAIFTYDLAGSGSAILNIIARISEVGGSTIDGLVQVDGTLPNANLWLINPYGLTFGPNAVLDVPGSFHASTADYIRLSDGNTYGVNVPAGGNMLSTAAPSAFGFLSGGDGAGSSLVMQSGANLTVDNGETISLVSGYDSGSTEGLTVSGATINAQSGQVNLVSVDSEGAEVGIGSGAPDVSGFSTLGPVDINSSTSVSVSGNAASTGADGASGAIYIRGGSLSLNSSSLAATNYSDTDNGGDINIGVSGDATIENNATISQYNRGDADSGDIIVSAGTLVLDDATIYSLVDEAGDGGDVTLVANDGMVETTADGTDSDIIIRNGSLIYSDSIGSGRAGSIYIGRTSFIFSSFTDTLYIDGSEIYSNAFGGGATEDAGNVRIGASYATITNGSNIHSDTSGSGNAGFIQLSGTEWTVDGGSTIGSEATAGSGNAGTVAISVSDFTLDNATISTSVTGGTGNAGSINTGICNIFCIIFGDPPTPTSSLTLQNGASITSDTLAVTGDAGSINVLTGMLTVDGSTISSITNDGLGGDIVLDASTSGLITNSSTVTASTNGDGNAGLIQLLGGAWTIDGGSALTSNVNFSTFTGAQAGDIIIGTLTDPVASLTVDGASVSTNISLLSFGDAGRIGVNATGDVVIENGATLSSSTAIFSFGNAGNISIAGDNVTIQTDAQVFSNSFLGSGDAGTIDITAADTFTLTDLDSFVSTNTSSGAGGDITITADTGYINNGGEVTSNTSGNGDAGSIQILGGDWELTGFYNTTDADPGNWYYEAQVQTNQTDLAGLGDAGDITFNVESLDLINDGRIESNTISTAVGGGGETSDAGNIMITATDGMDNPLVNDLYLSGGVPAIVSNSEDGVGDAGNITIVTGTMLLDTADIFANNSTGAGGTINITADYGNVVGWTYIRTNTSGSGNAGNIIFNGGDWVIQDPFTEVTSNTTSSGNAGSITMNLDSLDVNNNALISSSSTSGSGNAGSINITVDDFMLDGATISTNTDSGVGGSITITANNTGLVTNDDASAAPTMITSNTEGDGDAGSITLLGGAWTIEGDANNNGDGSDLFNSTVVSSSADTMAGELGNAGEININVDTLMVDTFAQVTTNTGANSPANAGNISVTANQVNIEGEGTVSSSSGAGTGNAGSVTISTPVFVMDNGNVTTATSDGTGGTGNIMITASTTGTVSNGSRITANTDGTDNAGSVTLMGGDWTLQTSSVVSSSAQVGSTGDAGQINIGVNSLLVDTLAQVQTNTGGATPGNAGDIIINTPDLTIQRLGQINSSSEDGTGNAGNIMITTDNLFMDYGVIRSVTNAGQGGNISITANTSATLVNTAADPTTNPTFISAESVGSGQAGNIGLFGGTWSLSGVSAWGQTYVSSSQTEPTGSGDAGNVLVDVSTLRLMNYAQIQSDTLGTAVSDAGTVTIIADDGIDEPIPSAANADLYIANLAQVSSTSGNGNGGDAGSVTIDTGTLFTENFAIINTITNAAVNDVDVATINITADYATLTGATLILSNTLGAEDAGNVFINGGNWLVDFSLIQSSASGGSTGNAGQIGFNVDNLTVQNGAIISTSTETGSMGNAGNIGINATNVTIQSGATVISSSEDSDGDAGNIVAVADNFVLTGNGSEINTVTNNGTGGTIDITANVMGLVDNQASITANTVGSGNAGDIFLRGPNWLINNQSEVSSSAEPGSMGNAGQIGIFVDSLTINNLAEVVTNSESSGNAGNIAIVANTDFSILGGGEVSSSSADGTGDAGNVFITTPMFTMNDGEVTTETSEGAGGTITIDSAQALITNESDVTADTEGNGDAGSIFLLGGTWLIEDGSAVTSNSDDENPAVVQDGAAGNVTAVVTSFTVDDATVQTNSNEAGDSGFVDITAGVIRLRNNAEVSSNTTSFGNGGEVRLTSSSNVYLTSGALVSTTTSGFDMLPDEAGNAGDIYITANSSLLMDSSTLTSSTTGDGDAGSIYINTGDLVYLLNSTVFADADTLSNVGGGNLFVDTGILVLDSSTLDVSSNFATGGLVEINADYFFISADSVIDVSSTFGASGTLSLNAVAIDLSGSLNTLDISFQDASKLLRETCSARSSESSSSFVVNNTNIGIPASPDEPQSGSVLDDEQNELIDARGPAPYPGMVASYGPSLLAASGCGGL